jgi:hypothetical protein
MQALQTTPLVGISVERFGDDPFRLRPTIQGLPGTPMEGGTFVLDLKIPLACPINSAICSSSHESLEFWSTSMRTFSGQSNRIFPIYTEHQDRDERRAAMFALTRGIAQSTVVSFNTTSFVISMCS